jgi:hypothetical protein
MIGGRFCTVRIKKFIRKTQVAPKRGVLQPPVAGPLGVSRLDGRPLQGPHPCLINFYKAVKLALNFQSRIDGK